MTPAGGCGVSVNKESAIAMKTCSSCGYNNEDDATYCAACGAPLSSAEGESIVKADTPPADFNYGGPVNENTPPTDFNYSYNSPADDNGPVSTPGSSAYAENGNSANQAGSGHAKASLVLGIISLVCLVINWLYLSLVSIILGIIGLVLASSAKKEGNKSGIRTAGFVTSLIGLILGVLCFVACACIVAVVGTVSLAALPEYLEYYDEYSEYLDNDTFDVALQAAKALLMRR